MSTHFGGGEGLPPGSQPLTDGSAPASARDAARWQPAPSAYTPPRLAGSGANGHSPARAATAVSPAPAPAPMAPARAHPSGGPEPMDADLQKHTTTRMAMLSRDPAYLRMHRTMSGRRRLRNSIYEFTFLLDIALSLVALLVAQRYRAILSHFLPISLYVHVFGVQDTVVLALLVVTIWPIVFSAFKLYDTSWIANPFAPLRIVPAVCVATLLTSGMLYFLSSALDRTRIFLMFFTVLDAALLIASRLILRPLVTVPALRRRVLIVGTGRLAVEAAHTIAERRKQGVELVGIVGPERDILAEAVASGEHTDDRDSARYRQWLAWRLGELHNVVEIVQEHTVDVVLVALNPTERYETSWVISSVAHLPVQVYVLPDVVTETAKTVMDNIDGMPIIGITESAISGWNARIKRLADLLICIPLLLLTWPLLLLIAVAVRLESRGPAIFAQERIGQHNRRFIMYKFRSMFSGADQQARQVAARTAQGLVHKRRGDPRVTRVGAFLRKTSLDELPQLVNVLKGDMSIVGPRPELPWIAERYRAWQYRRLLVPQGITGWWQVHGRSDRVLHLHTQDDIYYVRNHSLWLDFKILLMTIKVVITGKGAY